MVPTQDLSQSKDMSPAHAWLLSRGAKGTATRMVPLWSLFACSITAQVSTEIQSLVALSQQGRKGRTGPHGDALIVASP